MTKKDELKKFREYLLKNKLKGHRSAMYSMKNGNIEGPYSTECHAGMSYKQTKDSDIWGITIPEATTGEIKTKQDFLEWLVSDQSLYKPLMDYLGKDFEVLRDKDDYIIGFIFKTTNVSNKICTNFVKATRTVGEHQNTLRFWEKYKMKKGYHPGLVWFVSFFYTVDGKYAHRHHSPIEGETLSKQKLALYRFVDHNHGDWKLDKEVIKNSGYAGENLATFGHVSAGRKGFYITKMPRVTKVKHMNTYFLSRYEKKKLESKDLSVEDFDNFFKNYKEYVL